MIANYSSWMMKEKERMEEGRKREQRERRREKEDTTTPLFEDWRAKKRSQDTKGQDTGKKPNALR